MAAKATTKWDAAVMVLRWWRDKGHNPAELFVIPNEVGIGTKSPSRVDKRELSTFLAGRLTNVDKEKEIGKFIPAALSNLANTLQNKTDTPDYISSALSHAIEVSGGPTQLPGGHSVAPRPSTGIQTTTLEAPLVDAHEAIHSAAVKLVAPIVYRWPAHGTDKARDAVKSLANDRSSDNHYAGYYRVLRWAAPSNAGPIVPRVGQAFAYLKPHTELRVGAPFASFSLFYRPRTAPLVRSNAEADGDSFHDDPLRISDGVVMPIQNHMYFIGQEHVEDIGQEHVEEEGSIGGTTSQGATRMTSGYPLIVACSLPNTFGHFHGIVLRQTDRESQILTSRVFFEKLKADQFGKTGAERYQGIRNYANAEAALYPVLGNGNVDGLKDGRRVLKLLNGQLRNVEPVTGPPESVGCFAITLPIT